MRFKQEWKEKGVQQNVFPSMASEEEETQMESWQEGEACSSLALRSTLGHFVMVALHDRAGQLAVQCKMDGYEAAVGLSE